MNLKFPNLRALALIVLASCSSAPQKSDSAPPQDRSVLETDKTPQQALKLPQWVEHRFSNGLKLLISPDPDVPVLSYQTWVRAGSAVEEAKKTGIAHLFEHLMFKGSKKFPGKAFFTELETRGAQVNAQTSRDATQFTILCSPELFEKAAEMEADRLTGLEINDETLQIERAVVFEELRLRIENSPQGKMSESLWQIVFPFHPYGSPIIGFPQDLLQLTTQDLLSFYQTYYQPSNVTIILSGNITPERAIEVIGKYYGSIPGKSVPSLSVENDEPNDSERRVFLRDEVTKPRFLHGYRITPAKSADTPALDVLSEILFGGQKSRLYEKLVLQKGIFSDIGGSSYTPKLSGLFTISASLSSETGVRAAENEIDLVLSQVKKEGVTDAEVASAVRQLELMTAESAQTPEGWSELLGLADTMLGSASLIRDDFLRYTRVTAEDVKRVAIKYLQPNNRSVVILLPKESKEEVL